MYMHCYIGAHVGACSVALVRMWVYALLHWCACGCIRSLALCAEDAIAAHCAEHLLLYMFVDALAAHCAEHILLYMFVDAIAALCAEHLFLHMFADALAAHCAEHILLYTCFAAFECVWVCLCMWVQGRASIEMCQRHVCHLSFQGGDQRTTCVVAILYNDTTVFVVQVFSRGRVDESRAAAWAKARWHRFRPHLLVLHLQLELSWGEMPCC